MAFRKSCLVLFAFASRSTALSHPLSFSSRLVQTILWSPSTFKSRPSSSTVACLPSYIHLPRRRCSSWLIERGIAPAPTFILNEFQLSSLHTTHHTFAFYTHTSIQDTLHVVLLLLFDCISAVSATTWTPQHCLLAPRLGPTAAQSFTTPTSVINFALSWPHSKSLSKNTAPFSSASAS